MEGVLGNYPALRGYGSVIGQGEASPMPRIDNGEDELQRVWNQLKLTCNAVLGEETCTRMLGLRPFVCPTGEEKPKICNLKTILIAAGIGVLVGKIIL